MSHGLYLPQWCPGSCNLVTVFKSVKAVTQLQDLWQAGIWDSDLDRNEGLSATTMGIANLWQVMSYSLQSFPALTTLVNQTVKPTARNDSLASYCMYHTIFESNDLLLVEPQIIGIDARWFFFIVHILDWRFCSIWMHECQAVFFGPCHTQMGENPELHTLFYRLAALLEMSIIPVFVFDGPNRPLQKRGRNVVTRPHWMTDRFKKFIEAFGFYYHTVSRRVWAFTICFSDSILRLLVKLKPNSRCSTKSIVLMQSLRKTAMRLFLVRNVY